MKNITGIKKWFLILLLASMPLTSCASGEKEGGGGNVFHSTPADVANWIKDGGLAANVNVLFIQVYVGLGSNAIIPIQDARARPILERIFALKGVAKCFGSSKDYMGCGSILDAAPSVIDVKTTGACTGGGVDRDASITFHKNEQGDTVIDTICFAAERLAIYPPNESLWTQVAALTIHELSHAAGYGEDDAVFIQNYVLQKLYRDCTIRLATQFDTYDVTIDMGYDPTVVHTRNFPQGGEIALKSSNFSVHPAPFRFEWTKDGGKIQFYSPNSDGSQNTNSVAWGAMVPDYLQPFYDSQVITDSNVSFNGEHLKIVGVKVDGEHCLR